MKTVSARLDIEVLVDCPYCDSMIDLLFAANTDGHDYNEEGAVIEQAVPNGDWHDLHKKFSVDDVECSECKGTFNVKELEW